LAQVDAGEYGSQISAKSGVVRLGEGVRWEKEQSEKKLAQL